MLQFRWTVFFSGAVGQRRFCPLPQKSWPVPLWAETIYWSSIFYFDQYGIMEWL